MIVIYLFEAKNSSKDLENKYTPMPARSTVALWEQGETVLAPTGQAVLVSGPHSMNLTQKITLSQGARARFWFNEMN